MLENEVVLKEETKSELASTISWSKYAAILSIISIIIGLLQIIVGLINGNTSILTSIISFLISSAISIVLSINLLNYSRLLKSGLNSHNSNDLYQALYHLKIYFTIIGILFIIAISLVVLGIIISLLSFAIN